MILHLVRHPPPRVAPGTCYGRLDVAADGTGVAAERLRGLLSPGLPVWSSPLRRCRELAECLHPAPLLDARLQEMHFGEWEGLAWEVIGAAALDAWAADVAEFAPPGGESARALQARCLAFVAALSVDEAVLVTHGGVMRMLLAHWLQVPPAQWTTLTFDYGTVTSVAVAAGEVRVLRLNR